MAPLDLTGDVTLFTPGRACAGPLAIVLHSYGSGLEVLDLDMQRCLRPRPLCSPGCHTSFHYGIGSGCITHQYVDITDTAWGFGLVVPTCPAPICPPDPCASCTGLTVDQYNTDIDGNPPVLPVFGADAQCPGTANCGVIHVAVAGTGGFSALDPFGSCCNFFGVRPENASDLVHTKAYACFVKQLCEIFEASGLTPSQTTLLVHCEELVCIDIDQLILDILACINAPEPPPVPCQCTPTTEQFCAALALLPTSITPVALALGTDCQFHPITPTDVTLTAVDTASVNSTIIEAPANTFTVSADAIVSPDAGNTLEIRVNGLFADRGALAVVPVLNAGTIDPTSGDDVFVYSGVGAGAVTLVNPVAGEKTDLWVKNISASVLTITAASLIDGVGVITLDGTIPAGYPFGNNGGESVHLVFDTANTTWYVL